MYDNQRVKNGSVDQKRELSLVYGIGALIVLLLSLPISIFATKRLAEGTGAIGSVAWMGPFLKSFIICIGISFCLAVVSLIISRFPLTLQTKISLVVNSLILSFVGILYGGIIYDENFSHYKNGRKIPNYKYLQSRYYLPDISIKGLYSEDGCPNQNGTGDPGLLQGTWDRTPNGQSQLGLVSHIDDSGNMYTYSQNYNNSCFDLVSQDSVSVADDKYIHTHNAGPKGARRSYCQFASRYILVKKGNGSDEVFVTFNYQTNVDINQLTLLKWKKVAETTVVQKCDES